MSSCPRASVTRAPSAASLISRGIGGVAQAATSAANATASAGRSIVRRLLPP